MWILNLQCQLSSVIFIFSVILLVNVWQTENFVYAANEESEFMRISSLSENLYRSKKYYPDQLYVEQCRYVNPWNKQLGYVNVFAFLSISSVYSYRQAVMLRLLKKRLEKAGFLDIWFFAIAAPPNFAEDRSGDEIEIETWKKISGFMSEDILSSAKIVSNDFESNIEADIIFIQDTSELGLWERFRASKNQIVIIDRCGKLTYQIILPWSILYFPYVKAAILSTYKEDPCGTCNVKSILRPMDYEEYLLESMTTKQENNSNNFPAENVQNTTETYNTTDFAKNENVSFTLNTSRDENKNNPTMLDLPIAKSIIENTSFFEKSEVINEFETTTEFNYSPVEVGKESIYKGNNEVKATSNRPVDVDFEVTTISESEGNFNANAGNPSTTDSILTENYTQITHHVLENLSKPVNDSDNIVANNTNLDKSPIAKTANLNSNHEDIVYPTQNKDSEELESNSNEDNEVLPMRIIMRMPHLHEEAGGYKKYTSLILKMGNPDYHEHYDIGQDVTSQKQAESHESETSHNFHDPTLIEYIYNRDESPGLYGEIADHWNNYDDDEYINKDRPTESSIDYTDVSNENEGGYVSNTFNNQESSLKFELEPGEMEVDQDTDVKSNSEESVYNIIKLEEVKLNKGEDVNDNGETREKLINHYKKLLPWVYYLL